MEVVRVSDGVHKNANGGWDVVLNGNKVAQNKTNSQAWRIFDRASLEAISKAEDTGDWLFKRTLS